MENISLGQFAGLEKLQTVLLTGNRIQQIQSQVQDTADTVTGTGYSRYSHMYRIQKIQSQVQDTVDTVTGTGYSRHSHRYII